jgi:thiol-disulfide isomerase/thioredoxin
LSDFAGRVVLLNLWATWCAPCVREMPTLDRLQAELGGPDFEVVALSSDRAGAAAVEPFFRTHGLSRLGVYLDPQGEATRALGTRGLPTTVLIDREGREVGRLEGVAEWDSPEAKALIRAYIDRKG